MKENFEISKPGSLVDNNDHLMKIEKITFIKMFRISEPAKTKINVDVSSNIKCLFDIFI